MVTHGAHSWGSRVPRALLRLTGRQASMGTDHSQHGDRPRPAPLDSSLQGALARDEDPGAG